MALKSSYSFLVVFAILMGSSLFGASTALVGRKTLPVYAEAPTNGGDIFVVLDPNDPKVVEIAKFAIGEYNKEQNVNVSFNRVVVAASTKNPDRTNYAFIAEATDATGLRQYDFVVIVFNDGTRKLISYN